MDNTPNSTKNNALKNHCIENAVVEIQLLVEYIATNGLTVTDADLFTAHEAKKCISTSEWTTEKEVEFWKAYANLSKVVAPVTVESLKATKDEFGELTFLDKLLKRAPISNAHRLLNNYRILSFFVLIVILVGQIIWLIGTSLVHEAETQKKLLTEQLEDFRMETFCYSKQDTFDRLKLEESNEHIKSIIQDIYINQTLILGWLGNIKSVLFTFDPVYKVLENRKVNVASIEEKLDLALRNKDYHKYLSQARTCIMAEAHIEHAIVMPLRMILLYPLPLLYGLLGACAYVLRTIGREIKTLSYDKQHKMGFGLRVQLGSLAGLIISWIFSSGMMNDIATQSVVTNLSFLAVSFVAGYNIELFFQAMDQYLLSFIKPDKVSKKDLDDVVN